MKLTEQNQLNYSPQLSHLCYLSKNLYNLANFYVRQEYFFLGNWLRYYDLWHILKDNVEFKKLPSQTAQQTLRLVDQNWISFYNSLKNFNLNPKKFIRRPKPPQYKKKNSECVVILTNQQCKIRSGFLIFPKKTLLSPVKTRISGKLHCVRIIPKGLYYVLEIIYQKGETNLNLDRRRVIGIDLGLTNIITMVNNAGLQPAIIKGGLVKSINQFYNKELAKYNRIKAKQRINSDTNKIKRLTRKRNNKIKDVFHKISREIINYCIQNNFGTIVIGYNKSWKQKPAMGKRNNQNFYQIPFARLVFHIQYKSKLIGINVFLEPESFTSKCSFLDNEVVEKHRYYKGNRVSRGLYQSQNGILINADVNAAYNILKKAVPKAILVDEIEGVGLHPYSIVISN